MAPTRQSYTECVICQTTLGSDSRDAGYSLCHEHRKCCMCGESISVPENTACLKASEESDKSDLEVIHAHCRIARQNEIKKDEIDPTITIKQSEYDFLNLCRLSIIPNPDLNITTNEKSAKLQGLKLIQNMNFETLQKHASMMEACAMQVRLFLNSNPKVRKELSGIRESERLQAQKQQATQEALTSSRPTHKKANDPVELQLAHFMEIYEIKERETGLKLMKEFNKSINDLMKAKFSEKDARDMTVKFMKMNRKLG